MQVHVYRVQNSESYFHSYRTMTSESCGITSVVPGTRILWLVVRTYSVNSWGRTEERESENGKNERLWCRKDERKRKKEEEKMFEFELVPGTTNTVRWAFQAHVYRIQNNEPYSFSLKSK